MAAVVGVIYTSQQCTYMAILKENDGHHCDKYLLLKYWESSDDLSEYGEVCQVFAC